MKFRPPPPKEHCFEFSAPKEATVDDIIDGIDLVAGPEGLRALQHLGASRFCVAMASAAAAAEVNKAGEFKVLGKTCPVTCIGPQIVFMTVLRLKLFIANDDLAAALAPFGRVIAIQDQVYKGHPRVDNGTRCVKIEMKKPVPNFINVRGCKVQCEYRGVKRVCSRCGQTGHNRGDCEALWCERCQVFGHEAALCKAQCRKCGGSHPTADCLKPRTYAAALDDFPALPGRASVNPGTSTEQDQEEEPHRTDLTELDTTSQDGSEDFVLEDVSSPLSPFGDDDSVTESGGEPPSEQTSNPELPATKEDASNTTKMTPLPTRGRGTSSRGNSLAARPATSRVLASGNPAASTPPTETSTARPATPATVPPDSCVSAPDGGEAHVTDELDMENSNSARYDPSKRGLPSSSESDNAREHSKKPRPT